MLDIIQGEQQPYKIDLTSKKTGLPFDLTGNVEIEVCFKAGSTIIIKKKTLGEVIVDSLILGQISGNLEVSDTNSMTPLTDGAIEVSTIFALSVAQISNIDVTGATDGTYTISINGVEFSFVASSNSAAEIRDGLVLAINAGNEPVTAAPGAGDSLDLTADVAGVPFVVVLVDNPNTNMILSELTANVFANIKKAQILNAFKVTEKICP